MTVGQFKKFVSLFTLNDTKIKYFEYPFLNNLLREELDDEDIFDDYIVCVYTMFLESNEVHVFVKGV